MREATASPSDGSERVKPRPAENLTPPEQPRPGRIVETPEQTRGRVEAGAAASRPVR